MCIFGRILSWNGGLAETPPGHGASDVSLLFSRSDGTEANLFPFIRLRLELILAYRPRVRYVCQRFEMH